MQWTIPGTTLTGEREDADRVDGVFQALFLAGGLTLSQVSSVTGLEPHTIQNWVKRGFLSPPRGKRYDMEQVCRILNINLLKGVLTLEQCCQLISYINGSLTDESDDLIDDTLLYFFFVRLAARARHFGGSETWDGALEEVTDSYREPVPGAREKLARVLKIMLTAWLASRLKAETEQMISQL
ncbi:MAG: DUF1836 domain-containing protein [Faecousia sp.]